MQINNILSNFTNRIKTNKNEQKKVDNSQITFEGKTKVFMGAGSALAASALFSLSKEHGINPSECASDFYQDKLNSTSKKGQLESSLKRFSPEERYEIEQNIEEIKLFPNVFRTIADLKINDTEYRFDAEDTMTLFLESAKGIEKNPKVFEKIIKVNDNNGRPRFSANDCVVLMNNAKYISANSAEFLVFANAVNEDGNPMYDVNECVTMLRNLPQNELIEEDKAVNKKKAEPEKLKSLIARIRQSDNKNPIILNTGETVSKENTKKIQQNFVTYNNACRELIKLKNQNGTPRLTEKETCELLAIMDKLGSKHAGRLYPYLTLVNDDNTPVFTNAQCIKILRDSNHSACMSANTIFQVRKPDGSLRFTPEEYINFLTNNSFANTIKEHSSEFVSAAAILNETKEPKYSASDCLTICQNVKKYPDVFKKLIETENEIYSLKIKPQDIIELGEDFKFLYLSHYNRSVYSKVFELKEKFGIDKEVIKNLKPFIADNQKYISVVTPQTFARFLEANYSDGKFDMENMQENIEHLRKFKMSKEKFEALMELKLNYGLAPADTVKFILANS